MLLSLLSCTTADPSWETEELFGPGERGAVEVVGERPADPRFPSEEELATLEDPWTVEESDEPAEPEAPVEPEVAEVEVERPDAEPAPVEAPLARGLPSAPVWGVRLLNTLPQAMPPRAALGLPSGEEIVVAPGSMLPEVGVVVIAVGDGTAQLAKVSPNGDHALVETATLAAQYPARGED